MGCPFIKEMDEWARWYRWNKRREEWLENKRRQTMGAIHVRTPFEEGLAAAAKLCDARAEEARSEARTPIGEGRRTYLEYAAREAEACAVAIRSALQAAWRKG